VSNPNVSVILPVYNAEAFLADAIESILSQDHKSFELIILNDGSTDSSHKIIGMYADDPRVRYVERENRGLGETLNELVGLARAGIIARMDADDISLQGRLRAQWELLASRPEIGMCGTNYEFLVDGHTTASRGAIVDPRAIRSALLQGRFPVCHPTLMFRRSIFESIGGYRLRGCGEDLDMFLRFSEVSLVTNVSSVYFRYRLHGKSLAASRSRLLAEGYAYARECARARVRDEPEVSVEEFFSRMGPVDQIRTGIYVRWFSVSERLNRETIISKAKGQSIRATICLALTAILRPKAAWARVLQLVFQRQSRGNTGAQEHDGKLER